MSEGQTPATGRAKARVSPERELGHGACGQGRPALHPLPPQDLTLCPRCECDLVYPVDWEAAGSRGWSISLRCPECEWRSRGVFSQDVADRFDDALDVATQALLDDLQLLTRSNMESQINRFVKALEVDWILPEDF
ncbi:MAG: hypothetical protein M3331_07210 [Actinomycetota bacterium]|nr:hypothetical protein [Actinomycetota bacterium]